VTLSGTESKSIKRIVAALALIAGIVSVISALSEPQSLNKGPCEQNLDSCPPQGCAHAGTTDALLNMLKRRFPPSDRVASLSFKDFATLQTHADRLVGQNIPLVKLSRDRLKNLTVSGGAVSEGDLVEMAGFIVGAPHPNRGGESVNCRLRGLENNDIHITLARERGEAEYRGIVAAMIPQGRPPTWTVERLREIQQENRMLLVRGQLLYDNKHIVNADPQFLLPGQPKRFTLWEVHPVTQIYVCRMEDHACNPEASAEWELFGEATSR